MFGYITRKVAIAEPLNVLMFQGLTTTEYTQDQFLTDGSNGREFYSHVHSHYAQRSFQNTDAVPIFASAIRLLRDGRIANDRDGTKIYEMLDDAHRLGYIRLGYIHLKDGFYVFSSPLIHFQWTWLVAPPRNYDLPYTLRTLVQDTFVRFLPVQFFGTGHRVGSSTIHPTEAQYQVEFYRVLHDITTGNACAFHLHMLCRRKPTGTKRLLHTSKVGYRTHLRCQEAETTCRAIR